MGSGAGGHAPDAQIRRANIERERERVIHIYIYISSYEGCQKFGVHVGCVLVIRMVLSWSR